MTVTNYDLIGHGCDITLDINYKEQQFTYLHNGVHFCFRFVCPTYIQMHKIWFANLQKGNVLVFKTFII